MNTGRLDQRVSLERFETTFDEDTGAIIETWVPYATLWAAVEPLNGREYIAAAAVQAEVTTRIRVRYRPGIVPTDRVDHEGTLYDITAVINPRSGDAELVLMCKASS